MLQYKRELMLRYPVFYPVQGPVWESSSDLYTVIVVKLITTVFQKIKFFMERPYVLQVPDKNGDLFVCY
jgi:hypothetical protein